MLAANVGASGRFMKYRLSQNFASVSAATIIALTAILAFAYDVTSHKQLVTSIETQNATLAALIADDLERMAPEHFGHNFYDPAVLKDPDHQKHIKDLGILLKTQLQDSAVAKLKIYRGTLTIFSSDASEIGEINDSPTLLKTLSEGMPVSELSFEGELSSFDAVRLGVEVVETYVPVRPSNTSAQKQDRLVLEIYTDVTHLVNEINMTNRIFVASIIVVAAVLYGTLLLYIRNAEKTIRSQHDEIISERKNAEEANRAKSHFLASMSHELRTPLNAIRGFSDVLSQEVFGKLGSAKYVEYAGDIRQSSDHLLNLINDLLDLSAIEAGKRDLKIENLKADEVIADCLSIIALAAGDKDLNVEASLAENLPEFRANRRAMTHILLNLLSNSVKFTQPGGNIEVRCHDTRDQQVFAVRDSGRGIAKGRLATITTPFAPREEGPNTASEGTGLGLSIVKSLVDLHAGDVKIESVLNEGTVVKISIPHGVA